jgi:hypothetical protein
LTTIRDHELPAMATREQEASFRSVFLVDDHGRCAELAMRGD